MQSEIKISQDERERAVFRSRRMYQTDLQSDLATAEDRGIHKGKLSTARLMIADGEPKDKIMRYTGLTYEEIEKL